MKRYAEGTEVSVDRSRAEIDRLLMRYGATSFVYGSNADSAMVAFEMRGRRVKFILPMPDRNADEFQYAAVNQSGARCRVSADQAYSKFERAARERWRALTLCIKAKLESVESHIETFEEAFLPHIVMNNGQTIGEAVLPDISRLLDTSKLPPMLTAGGHPQ